MNKPWTWLAVALLAAGLWATTPPRLEFVAGAVLPVLPDAELVPGTDERITRFASERSEWAIVMLHGFSATRQETAPLGEMLAERLGANLFEARLSGHGHADRPMEGVLAEHWLADAQHALEQGAKLGDKIIVIGTSTGATLATAMLDQDITSRVDTFVMISPNFRPADPTAPWATRPGGLLLARLVIGETTCWEPRNELQGKYWSTCYPTTAGIEVMRLVNYANRQLPADISQRLLVFYSQDDRVVSADAIRDTFEIIESPQKQLIEVPDSGDASNHVLAGDIMSPQTTSGIADKIVDFIGRPTP